jgi:predicted nucleotidyltransferase
MSQPTLKSRIGALLQALTAYQPERVYLFGSAAREEADELSDLDVVVIKRTSAPFFDRLLEVARLLPMGLGAVDLLVYTPEEFGAMLREGNAFTEMIVEEGRLIYGEPAQI